MEIIHHRRNTINLIKSTSNKYGIEVDIRSNAEGLIVNHDPYLDGVKFCDWLEFYNHSFLIINVKEDGLEEKILMQLQKFKIKKFFFLDQSFPSIIKLSSLGYMNSALRISEYESIETALKLKKKISWIWVDTFTTLSLTFEDYKKLKLADFNLCLVSPEINSNNKSDIKKVKELIKERNLIFDAVCTKFPYQWDLYSKN